MPASRTQTTTSAGPFQPAAADAGSRPAPTRCQQCGGVSTNTGTICDQCTQGLLSGQSAFPHRREQCGQPAGIAGRYCSRCLPASPGTRRAAGPCSRERS